VQLGHARKESGDSIGAEKAYLEALRQEPINADSWLQLGHVLKITGRKEEAIAAYRRSAVLPGATVDSLRELLAFGEASEVIERLLMQSSQNAPAEMDGPRTLLFDVTPWWRACREAREPTLDAAWCWSLARLLIEQGRATPVALIGEQGFALVNLAADTDQAVAENPLPEGAILLSCLCGVEPLQLASGIRHAVSASRIALVAVCPEVAMARTDGAQDQRWLASLLQDASVAIGTESGADGILQGERAVGLGRWSLPTTARPSIVKPRRVVCLEPQLAAEAALLREAWARAQAPPELVFLGHDAKVSSPDFCADDVLFIPASRRDSLLWVAAAMAAGAGLIISSRAAAAPNMLGHVPFIDTFNEAAVDAWLTSGAEGILVSSDLIGQTLLRYCEELTQARVLSWRAPVLPLGRFMPLAEPAGAAELTLATRMVIPRGATALEPAGIRMKEGLLSFVTRSGWRGNQVLKLLVSADSASSVAIALTKDNAQCISTVAVRSGWQWLEVKIPCAYSFDACPVQLALSTETGLILRGVFLYPSNEDRLWFEFLDHAARGEVPEIGEVIWSSRLPIQTGIAQEHLAIPQNHRLQ
jgi:hypothetical protein